LTAEAARPPTPLVIWALAGAILLSYGAFVVQPTAQQNAIDYALAVIPARFDPESPERYAAWHDAAAALFGHAFLHVAWWHAGLNAFFFFLLGRLPALKLGWWRFLIVFFSGAVLGGILFVALNWNDDRAAIGASGAVCGVFSAYFLSLRPTWRQSLADPRVRNAYGVIFFLNVVLMGIAAESGVFPIAWEGHLGGFIGGAIAYVALAPRPHGPWG
jgi:membrane associated rhomboid family serine protease